LAIDVPNQSTAKDVPQVSGMYARKATGLVRDIPLGPILALNGSATAGIGLNWAISVFIALTAFPQANLVLAMGISIVLAASIWVAFALVAALIPRDGGDYTINSRLLHPSIGFAANAIWMVAGILAAGSGAWLMAQVGIGPALAIIGTTVHSNWMIEAATTVTGKTWTFVFAALSIIFVSIVCMLGSRKAASTMAALFWLALVGYLLAVVVLLFKTHTGFVNDLNHFSQPFTHSANTYAETVAAGEKMGLGNGSGYSSNSTFGALFFGLNATVFVMGGMYLGGEMRGAGRRKRQLIAVVGTGLVQGLLLLAGTAIVLNTAGYTFTASASAGNLALPAPAYPNLFAAIASDSSVIAVIVSLSFLLTVPCALYFGLTVLQRCPFAWSFDNLVPPWLSKVSDRTNAPINAILVAMVFSIACAALVTYSSSFVTLLSILNPMVWTMVAVTCLGGALAIWRRRSLFTGSVADWRLGGIPVLPLTGFIGFVISIFGIGLTFHFHESLGISSLSLAIGVPVGTAIVALLYWFARRAYLRGRGINLDLAYREIPPE
jgi:APA family basic amino acid/polyamine antiporter